MTSGGRCGREDLSEPPAKPLSPLPLPSQHPPPTGGREKACQAQGATWGGAWGAQRAVSVDINTGVGGAELTGRRPRSPLSVGVVGEGASPLCSQPSPNPGPLSPPSWLFQILPGLELNRPPPSLYSWALTLLLGSHKLIKVSKSK